MIQEIEEMKASYEELEEEEVESSKASTKGNESMYSDTNSDISEFGSKKKGDEE